MWIVYPLKEFFAVIKQWHWVSGRVGNNQWIINTNDWSRALSYPEPSILLAWLRENGWAEFGYFLCYFKMVALRAGQKDRRLWGREWLPRGTVNFVSRESQCFPRGSRGKHWDSRETKFTVPQGTSHKVICSIARQNKRKIWKPRWDSSDHVQQRSTFRG